MKKPFILLPAFVLLSFKMLFAQSQYRGGYISAEYIGTSIYHLQLQTFTKPLTGACYTTLEIWNSSGSVKLGLLDSLPRLNGIAGTCDSVAMAGEIIQTGVEHSVYGSDFTFPGPGTYLVRFVDGERPGEVRNISSPADVPLFLESMITIAPIITSNASPIALYDTVPHACAGYTWDFDAGWHDADGDSLSFIFTLPRTLSGENYEVPSTTGGGLFTLDGVTGVAHWSSPSGAGLYSYQLIVEEYRSGIQIGSILYENSLVVDSACTIHAEDPDAGMLTVFPNPATEVLVIQTQGSVAPGYAEVFNALGQSTGIKVRVSGNGQAVLDVSSLASGCYVLRIVTEAGVLNKKLIVAD